MSFIVPSSKITTFGEANHRPYTQFGELAVANRRPQIELNSAYGTSLLNDNESITGSASITSDGGEIVLSTGTTSGSVADLQSASLLRYMPGLSAETGVGVRTVTQPTSDGQILWGAFTDANGFYYGYDATDLFVARLKGGTEQERIYRPQWDDPLDGSGPSGVVIDPDDGNIWNINFTWYGYGLISFQVVARNIITTLGTKQTMITTHTLAVYGETSVETATLPLRTQIDNGTTESNLAVHVGGRQAFIVGQFNSSSRVGSARRVNVPVPQGSTFTPLLSARQDPTLMSPRSLTIDGLDVIAEAASNAKLLVELRIGASLTSPGTYTTPEDLLSSETVLQVEKQSTDVSGGHTIFQDIIPVAGGGPGSGGSNALSGTESGSISQTLAPGQVVTAVAMALDDVDMTATITLRVREEW